MLGAFRFYFKLFLCCDFWVLQNRVFKLYSLAEVTNYVSNHLKKRKSNLCSAPQQRQCSTPQLKATKLPEIHHLIKNGPCF